MDGRAQVSTNVFDLAATTLAVVYAAVRDAARQAGVAVAGAELVGLAPLGALTGETGLTPPVSRYALEPRLEPLGLAGWLEALGAATAAPAGIAAAATAAALGASLVAMVAGITRRKTGDPAWDAMVSAALAERDALLAMAGRDGWAVRSGDVERMDVSARAVAERAAAVVALAGRAASHGYAPAQPDARVAAALATVAAEAARRVAT